MLPCILPVTLFQVFVFDTFLVAVFSIYSCCQLDSGAIVPTGYKVVVSFYKGISDVDVCLNQKAFQAVLPQ